MTGRRFGDGSHPVNTRVTRQVSPIIKKDATGPGDAGPLMSVRSGRMIFSNRHAMPLTY